MRAQARDHMGEIPGTRRKLAISDEVFGEAGIRASPDPATRIRSLVEPLERVRCRDR